MNCFPKVEPLIYNRCFEDLTAQPKAVSINEYSSLGSFLILYVVTLWAMCSSDSRLSYLRKEEGTYYVVGYSSEYSWRGMRGLYFS